MSEKEFETLMNEPPTFRMKEPLRQAVNCSPLDRPSLWRDWIQSNKIRRGVVHQGRRATKKEAEKVVETVNDLMAYIERKPSDSHS